MHAFFSPNFLQRLILIPYRSSIFVLAAYQQINETEQATINYCIVELQLGKPHEQPSVRRENIRYLTPVNEVSALLKFYVLALWRFHCKCVHLDNPINSRWTKRKQ